MAALSPSENNALAPIPDSGLNRRDVITQVSKKRKRETCEAEDLPSGSFLAVVCSTLPLTLFGLTYATVASKITSKPEPPLYFHCSPCKIRFTISMASTYFFRPW